MPISAAAPDGSPALQRQDRVVLRVFLVSSLAVLSATVLSLASALLIPFALAMLFRSTLAPVVDRVQSLGLKKGWSVAIAMLGFASILFIFGAAMYSDVRQLGERFGGYRTGLRRNLDAWIGVSSPVQRMLHLADDPQPGPEGKTGGAPSAEAQLAAAPAATWLADLAASIAGAFLRFLGAVSLTLGLTTALLLHGDDLRDRLLRLAGFGHVTRSTRLLEDATRLVGAYLFWQVVANLGFGLAFALLIWLQGVPYATTWGILAAVARFVPYIGTWIGVGPALLLGAALSPTAGSLMLLLATTVVLGIAFNSGIDKMLTTRATGISVVALVISAAFWTWLWGPLGFVLATPITVCITVLGRHLEFLRPLAMLMERESNVEPSFRFYQRLAARRYLDAAEIAETQYEELGGTAFGDVVLAPALARLDADAATGVLDVEAAREALSEVEEILDEIASPATPSENPAVILAGARPTDALAASWLARLEPAQPLVAFAGANLMVSELVALIRENPNAVIVLTALDESGLARIRHLLKMLKRDGARSRVIVFLTGSLQGRVDLAAQLRDWGATESVDNYEGALRKVREYSGLAAAV